MILTLLLSILAGLGGAGAAQATTYNVTRADDPDTTACATPAGGCSLREALLAVNAGPSPPDVIKLPAGDYVNTLAAEFPVNQSVSILGAGSRTTIVHGSATSRVFHVGGTNADVSIAGVTITGGNVPALGGGGIESSGSSQLTLTGVAVTLNVAAFGGGVDYVNTAGPPLRVTDSLIAKNAAVTSGGGGGIQSVNATVLTNVTVTGNSAGQIGAVGGGLTIVSSDTSTIANSTIAANSVSLSGHGGNLFGTSSVHVRNTIIGYGLGPTASQNCFGTVTSEGYNLEDDHQCFASLATGDRVDTVAMLRPLPDPADAATTLVLVAGSPAVNAGDPAGCKDAGGALITHDQRGIGRPQGARCDIGAFEFALTTFSGPPAIAGTPKLGQTLTCNLPTVISPDGPPTTALAWLRDGTAVGTAAGYAVSTADIGHSLVCRLTATNAAGTSSTASAGVTVANVLPSLKLASKTVKLSAKTGKGTLTATCAALPGRSCALTGTLYGPGTLPGVKLAKGAKRAKKLGTLTGTIAADKKRKLALKLTSGARRQLKRKHSLKVRLVGTVSDKAGQHTSLRASLTIKAKKTK